MRKGNKFGKKNILFLEKVNSADSNMPCCLQTACALRWQVFNFNNFYSSFNKSVELFDNLVKVFYLSEKPKFFNSVFILMSICIIYLISYSASVFSFMCVTEMVTLLSIAFLSTLCNSAKSDLDKFFNQNLSVLNYVV